MVYKPDHVFLYHKTLEKNLESIRRKGLIIEESEPNILETVLEYWRTKFFPHKPSRLNSIFFTTTMATFFKYDMPFFGPDNMVLVFSFNRLEDLDKLELYEYNHRIIDYLWEAIKKIIKYDPFSLQKIELTEARIKSILANLDWEGETPSLNAFWVSVRRIKYIGDRIIDPDIAVFSKSNIPSLYLDYKIKVSGL